MTHKVHPAAWIAWATGAGLVVFTTTNPFYLLLVVATAWFVYAERHLLGTGGRAFRTFALGGLIAMALRTALVLLGTVNASNVAYAALEGARLAALLVVFGTFNAVADPSSVVRLAPRRFHEPALAVALALSIAPRTIAMAARVREAQQLRGIQVPRWRSLPALAVPVLETGIEDALILAESMDARGHGRGRRTRYRPDRWTPEAALTAAAASIAAGVFLTAAWTGRGGLHPATAPLAWPRVEPALLAVIGLLAVPGTFLRAANGLVPHFTGGTFTGRVLAGGRDTLAHPPRRLADVVAFVPQDPGASFVLDRVEDELAYGMENLGVDPPHMRRRIEEMLDLLDIEPLRDRSVRELSGGERQRVAIAAAMAAGPRILVLDEPTSQLDPLAAEHVVAALQRLVHDQGLTVLLAEHRLERVAGAVDMALGFDRGRVTAGGPAEVMARLPSGPPVARLGRLMGWDPVPLTVREARRMAKLPPASLAAAASAGSPLVEVKGLSATHGRITALRDVELCVREGEILAVMGRNGAGKTTLLRSIVGVHPARSGVVRVRGHAPLPGVDVALCPQEPETILFADTVAAEVRLTMHARGLGAGSPGPLLTELHIAHLSSMHPRDLSAGERLLVALAATAAARAPVLLLDEPTRGLDPETKRNLASFFRAHAGRGGSVLFATHDVELAAAVATRVVMLAGGEVIAEGSPGTVLGDSQVFAPQMTRAFGAGWLTPEQIAGALG